MDKNGKQNPLTSWLTINHACNLKCVWCYQKQFSGSKKSMPERLIMELIGLLSDLPVKDVILIGGEPTIHPLFLKTVKAIRSKGLTPKVVSNSIRFSDPNFVRAAEDAGLGMVVSSVKGFSEDEYKRATGTRVFNKLRTAIRNLDDSGIKHRISFTVTSDTISSWMELVAFAKSCKPFDFIFSFEKPCLTGGRICFEGGLLPREISTQIQELIYPTLVDAGVPFKIDYMFPHCQLPADFADKLELEGRFFSGCHLLSGKSIIFDPDGRVLPCNHLITCPLGQYGVDFTTANEYLAWYGDYINSEDFKISSSAPSERCVNCEKWEKCGAGCRLFWLFKGEKFLLPQLKGKEVRCYEEFVRETI